MADYNTPTPKKKKNEMIMTIFFLVLMSAASAAFIIYFRIKMKPYQLPATQTEKTGNSENTENSNKIQQYNDPR